MCEAQVCFKKHSGGGRFVWGRGRLTTGGKGLFTPPPPWVPKRGCQNITAQKQTENHLDGGRASLGGRPSFTRRYSIMSFNSDDS